MLSRFGEIHNSNRVETVRLPQIYQNKNADERHDEGYNLLKDFQKLLETRMESQNYPVK